MRRLLAILPFIVPFAVHTLYEPINRAWTVRLFGCGCPPIDGSWRFNANHFNLILWSGVALTSGLFWWFLFHHELLSRQYRRTPPLLVIGWSAILGICFRFWAKGLWL